MEAQITSVTMYVSVAGRLQCHAPVRWDCCMTASHAPSSAVLQTACTCIDGSDSAGRWLGDRIRPHCDSGHWVRRAELGMEHELAW